MMTALLDHLWQSTLFALLPAALALLLRRHEAGVRFWLWFAASVKFLLPFSALITLGAALALPAVPVISDGPTLMVLQHVTTPFATVAPASPVPAGTTHWIALMMVVVWAAGAMLALLVWGARWLRLRVQIRAARPLAMNAGLPVLAAREQIEPGIVGIWRPVLMLPEGIAARLSTREMDAILAHELCHFRRRDNLTAAIHMLVECLFWFHPLVRWLGQRMMAERERACDEAVVAAGNDPCVLAECILNVSRFYVQASQSFTSAISGADLRMRIETILANRPVRHLGRAYKWGLAILAALSIAVPVLAGRERTLAGSPDAARIAQTYAEQSRPRVAVAFNPADFDPFAGVYQDDTVITLSRDGGHFYAQRNLGVTSTHMMPHGPSEIFPESQSKFFAKDAVAQYSFTRDPMGRVNGLVFHQSGLERWFKRVDANAATAIAASVAARVRADKASPGTEAALAKYIQTMQNGAEQGSSVSTGLQARSQLMGGATARLVQSFGALQSLAFVSVAADGMDLYDASFAKGHVQWWIAPLSAGGRVVWVGFADTIRKN